MSDNNSDKSGFVGRTFSNAEGDKFEIVESWTEVKGDGTYNLFIRTLDGQVLSLVNPGTHIDQQILTDLVKKVNKLG